MNELHSAEAALRALRPVLRGITGDDLYRPTPCPGFHLSALADHLVGTITLVGDAAGAEDTTSDDQSIEARVTAATNTVIDAWRRRGTDGEAVFAGRVMPARLALGVLSLELVVHGWDFAQALTRPLPIAAAHADFVLDLARHIITPTVAAPQDSTNQCPSRPMQLPWTGSSRTRGGTRIPATVTRPIPDDASR